LLEVTHRYCARRCRGFPKTSSTLATVFIKGLGMGDLESEINRRSGNYGTNFVVGT